MNEKIRSIIKQRTDHEGHDSQKGEEGRSEDRKSQREAAKKAILDWWKENQQAIYIDTDSIKENCSIEEAIFNTFTADSYH